MSYRSNYTITVDNNNEKINEVFEWLNNESSESSEFSLEEEEIISVDNAWYEEEEDLGKLSLHFPDTVIEVFREGEDDDDKCYSYYKNGKVQHCPLELTYYKYDESKLVSLQGNYNTE